MYTSSHGEHLKDKVPACPQKNVPSTAGVLNLGSTILRMSLTSPLGILEESVKMPEVVCRTFHACVHEHFPEEGDAHLLSDFSKGLGT